MPIANPAQFLMAIERDGWATTGPVVPTTSIDRVIDHLAPLGAKRDDGSGRRGGVRDILTTPVVRELACSTQVRSVAELVLGPACFAVRSILFDKTPTSNWKVIWHQDLTIAVERRLEAPGFGPWTNKGGVPHVQAPVALLERMLAVRDIEFAAEDLPAPLQWNTRA